MQEQQDYISPLLAEFNTKIVDLEEKQRVLKDRILLIGENLIDFREEVESEISLLKVFTEQTKKDILKIRETLQRVLEEMDNKARASELDILKRQFKMFDPLKLARIEDVENMLKRGKDGTY